MFGRITRSSAIVFILLVVVSLIAAISILPPDAKEPHPDSAIFIYAGQQILNGDTLYKDLWDNKGPLLYYINALAVFISGTSMWGLFVIEYLGLLASILLGYLSIKKAFGKVPAVFASVVWPLALFYINDNGGNFTEEYSVPLGFAAIYLYLRSREKGGSLPYVFLIGVTFSLSFLLRPNNTGIQIAAALLIFISGILNRRYYRLIKEIIAYGLGVILVLGLTLLYFHGKDALGDFYDAFIVYNSAYSVVSVRDRIASLMFGLRLISPTGLVVVAAVAWFLGISRLAGGNDGDESRRALIALAALALPLEFLLSSLSGLTFNHYYLCWLPVLAIMTGYFIFELMRAVSSASFNFFNRKISLSYIWIFGFLAAMSFLALAKIPARIGSFVSTTVNPNTVLEAIKENLDDENYLLMWGSSAYYNYVTEVKSPSRYFHQLPLFLCAYTTDEMIEEFLDDVKQKKSLIVDTSATDIYLPPFDREERKKWKYMDFTERVNEGCTMSPKMEEVFDYVYSNYELVATTDRFKWKIYRYVGN